MKPTAIPRDPLKIPKPVSNPAAALIRDTLIHQGVTQSEAAQAMNISKAQLSDVIRQKKGGSLTAVIDELASARRTAGDEIPLCDAVRFYAANRTVEQVAALTPARIAGEHRAQRESA